MALPLVEEKEGFTTAVIRKPGAQKVPPPHAWLLLIILSIGVFYISTIREGHLWGDDFSIYISHARNIAEGRAYSDTVYIDNPRRILGPQTYPPVYPLLLAPVYKIWGLNLTAMKVETILIFLLSLFVIYLALRSDLQWPYLYALVALVGLNPEFWLFKENVLSDLPFLLFTYLSFYIIHKAYRTGRTTKSQILYALLISISIFLAYGTRTIGLVLIPCLLVYHITRRKRAGLFGISIILLTAVFIYVLTKSMHSLNAYAGHFSFGKLDFAWTHLRILVKCLYPFWTDGSAKLLPQSLFAVLSGLAAAGYLARVLKKQVTCLELFVPFYLAPFIFLQISLDDRFLFPIIPLYLFYVFLGIQTISPFGPAYRQQVERLIFAGVVIGILVSYARQYAALDYGPLRRGIYTAETQQIFEYVKKEIGEKEVVIFIRPRALSLFTGRASAIWHSNQDDEGLWDFFRQVNASYLISGPQNLDPADQTYLRDFLDRNRSLFEERFANAHFRVYRIIKYRP